MGFPVTREHLGLGEVLRGLNMQGTGRKQKVGKADGMACLQKLMKF